MEGKVSEVIPKTWFKPNLGLHDFSTVKGLLKHSTEMKFYLVCLLGSLLSIVRVITVSVYGYFVEVNVI